MHKDLIELKKILYLFDVDDSEEQDVDIVFGNVCCKTYEISRIEKYADLCNSRKELYNTFSRHCKKISKLCREKQCNNCFISKWCNRYRMNIQQLEYDRKAPTYADFFCGAGGLSWGFHRSGYKVSLANDIQECCVDTYSFNHPEIPEKHVVSDDINNILNNIEDLSRFKKIDVVIGGPPCQGFSMANRQRIIDDPRNYLYKSFVNSISILNPKFFVMENVKGMLNAKEQIIDDFNKIGYNATAHILNANNFGVPQNRERVIFIGNNIGVDNERIFNLIFNSSAKFKKTDMNDAIKNLPKLKAKTIPNSTEIENEDSGYTFSLYEIKRNKYVNLINENRPQYILFNHKARYNNSRDIEIFSRLNPGENSADPKIADIMPYKRREKIFKDKYYKLELDKPCKTITAHMKYDCNMYIHPSQARGLTPREAARIQSYPDDYYFRGSYTKTYMQVGNSVPPLLGEAIAKAIKTIIEEEV